MGVERRVWMAQCLGILKPCGTVSENGPTLDLASCPIEGETEDREEHPSPTPLPGNAGGGVCRGPSRR